MKRQNYHFIFTAIILNNIKRKFVSWRFSHYLDVSLPPGRRGLLSPNHVTPVFFNILDLEDSEKLGVTFRTHSFLLENVKKVLKIIIFWKKL